MQTLTTWALNHKTYSRLPTPLVRPFNLLRGYQLADLRPDLVAGLTVAVIALPQAIAFALVAELPPQMGLFTAVIAAAVGALWGSSNQIHTGPTNAISLLVLSSLLTTAPAGSPEFILAAGMLAVMAGCFQFILGLARLGVLVHFVSHSLVIGFAGGAGVLIAIGQVRYLLGQAFLSHNVLETIKGVISHWQEIHLATAALGVGTILIILAMRRISKQIPSALIGLILASIAVYIFDLDQAGVAVIGRLPSGLPPLAKLPLFNLDLIARLSTGALAVGAIGLVESTAIARAIATRTGQRLDSNQEFVGQGLANIFCGMFSGYPCAGSFSRSAINANAGARSPLAAIFSSVVVLIATFTLAPLTAYLPRACLAGVLILTAYRMIDRAAIARIWRGAPGDAAIMVATFLGTLFLQLEFAVVVGILLSFGIYIMRTSSPRVNSVVPDDEFTHLIPRPGKPECTQLGILDLLGDLYFGAVTHVEKEILHHMDTHPFQKYLLLRMHHVQQCDFSGIHMLESTVRSYQEGGGDVYFMQVRGPVMELMNATGFAHNLGSDHFLKDDEAIDFLFYKVLDPAVCIYECNVRVFRECQNLPKPEFTIDLPAPRLYPPNDVEEITPLQLWEHLHQSQSPLVVDLREPREYRRGHIDGAELLPLPKLLTGVVDLPEDKKIVFACRSGRRSARAIAYLQERGGWNLSLLKGGMLAWEKADLLTAVDEFADVEVTS